MNLQQIMDQLVAWISQAVSIALLLLICGAVASAVGIRASFLPRFDPTAVAWLCGAFWLWRGGKL